MISIVASIILAISVLVATLITFTPNARMITESDFMRNARNNALLYSWERAQLEVRTGNLIKPVAPRTNSKVVPLGNVSDNGRTQQSLSATISYTSNAANPIDISVS